MYISHWGKLESDISRVGISSIWPISRNRLKVDKGKANERYLFHANSCRISKIQTLPLPSTSHRFPGSGGSIWQYRDKYCLGVWDFLGLGNRSHHRLLQYNALQLVQLLPPPQKIKRLICKAYLFHWINRDFHLPRKKITIVVLYYFS